MTDNMERAPLTTIVYVTGSTPTERKDKMRQVLVHAVKHCAEGWLTNSSFDDTVDNFVETIEDEPDVAWNAFEESDYREPIHQIRVNHDTTQTSNGLARLDDGISESDLRVDVVVTEPDDICNRATGVSNIEALLNQGANVHFSATGVTLNAGTDVTGATKRAVMTLSDAVHPQHSNDGESYAHTGGRPPLGYTVEDGRLVEDEDYHMVCKRLQQVVDQIKSKNRAAKELGCARGTIINAIEDRPEMYGLDV